MAADRLQNIPIVDQLASSINLQTRDELSIPDQRVPELPAAAGGNFGAHQLNLLDDNLVDDRNDDEELNSEISPQHQLFNGQAIRSLEQTQPCPSSAHGILPAQSDSNGLSNYPQDSINLDDISSDIEEHPDDSKDETEIDLLSGKPIVCEHDNSPEHMVSLYRDKYKTLVHAIRKEKQLCDTERVRLENQRRSLEAELFTLRSEVGSSRASNHTIDSNTGSAKNIAEDRSSTSSSPQPVSKAAVKIRDLEKLLAKCKESLKSKNSSIKSLKDQLSHVEIFSESFQKLKNELIELKSSYETWTVSIAENKRLTHEELEIKNGEIDTLKSDIGNLNVQLKESNMKIVQLRSTLQDLESRLVSTSAAHQKERESLKKELTQDKINSLKQVQKDHELRIERVKLELEKAVEALKSEILSRDEQIIKLTNTVQSLQSSNQSLQSELEETQQNFQDRSKIAQEFKSNEDKLNSRIEELERQLDSNQSSSAQRVSKLEALQNDLEAQVESLKGQLDASEATKVELESKLETKSDAVAFSSTEFEYLKNIGKFCYIVNQLTFLELYLTSRLHHTKVYQFMLGKEPMVLARVISAVFKFDKTQIEQVCKAQESIQSV